MRRASASPGTREVESAKADRVRVGSAASILTRLRASPGLGLSRPGRGKHRVVAAGIQVVASFCLGPILLSLVLLPLILFVAPAGAQEQVRGFPPLTGRVVDAANVIPPADEAALTALLAAHEAKTSNQVVVATVASLGGQDIAEYGVALGRAWGIGWRDSNNGVILLVAPNEREVRIEVGYGLEGELTDAIGSFIVQGSILPRFKAGDLPGGIRRGAEDIVAVLEGDAAAFAERAKERVNGEDTAGSVVSTLVFIVIMMVWLGLFGGGRRRRYGGMGPIIFGGGLGGGGGSSGGGWSGGGGSFGGGGASGRW